MQQRSKLRSLAEQRATSMSETLDAALEALRRDSFFRAMASAEQQLRVHPEDWDAYIQERDEWLSTDLR